MLFVLKIGGGFKLILLLLLGLWNLNDCQFDDFNSDDCKYRTMIREPPITERGGSSIMLMRSWL